MLRLQTRMQTRMQIERRSWLLRPFCDQRPSSNNFCSNAIIKCLDSRPGSELRATSDSSEAAVAVQVAAVAAVSAVIIHPAAAELYNALQPKRCKCCVGTGFILCSTCQGRGRQGLTLPGEDPSHTACTACGRKGRCQCTECDGSGLENWWLWQPASDPGWGPRGN